MSLDGHTKERLVRVRCEVSGVATARKLLFWTEIYCRGKRRTGVYRANIDGTRQRRLAAALFPENIVVAGNHVYWIETGAREVTIARAKPDGSGLDRRFLRPTSPEDGFDDLATDGIHLYFTRCGTPAIGRVNLDGSNVRWRFIELPAKSFCPQPLAYNARYLYWSEAGPEGVGEIIGRAPLSGGRPERGWLTVRGSGAYIAAGAGKFFWTWGGGAGSQSYVGQATLAGRIVTTRFVPGYTADVG